MDQSPRAPHATAAKNAKESAALRMAFVGAQSCCAFRTTPRAKGAASLRPYKVAVRCALCGLCVRPLQVRTSHITHQTSYMFDHHTSHIKHHTCSIIHTSHMFDHRRPPAIEEEIHQHARHADIVPDRKCPPCPRPVTLEIAVDREE